MVKRTRERGVTLIEVMIGGAIVLIAVVGLMSAATAAATATAGGHRRTVAVQARQELADRITVLPRSTVDSFKDTGWILNSCFDVDARRIALSSGKCAGMYASWFKVSSPVAGRWAIDVYTGRLPDCDPERGDSRLQCASSTIVLTD